MHVLNILLPVNTFINKNIIQKLQNKQQINSNKKNNARINNIKNQKTKNKIKNNTTTQIYKKK